jgi:hypothetical protein
MPLSYDFIEKPPQVEIIDRFFSGSAEDRRSAYETARNLLENGEPLHETTARIASAGPGPLRELTQEDAGHFREHWLDSGKDKHPWSGPEVDGVMRRAYAHAVERASANDLPIETFWVFSPIEQFEMRVSESATQVTVFALIPKTSEIQFDDGSSDRIRRFGPEDSGSSAAR